MLNMRDMVVGHRYLAGDGLGYDIVECVDHCPPDVPEGCHGVTVRFVKDGRIDYWFEDPNFGTGFYIEPRP